MRSAFAGSTPLRLSTQQTGCPFLALSRHRRVRCTCPLSEVKQTCRTASSTTLSLRFRFVLSAGGLAGGLAEENENNKKKTKPFGGRGEIRTHERLAPLPVFKTGALNRSATLPCLECQSLSQRPNRTQVEHCNRNCRRSLVRRTRKITSN